MSPVHMGVAYNNLYYLLLGLASCHVQTHTSIYRVARLEAFCLSYFKSLFPFILMLIDYFRRNLSNTELIRNRTWSNDARPYHHITFGDHLAHSVYAQKQP